MAAITIELSDERIARLREVAQLCADADAERSGATTHGALTAEALLAMLAEDATFVIGRPGCWEAQDMATVLSAHGYEI